MFALASTFQVRTMYFVNCADSRMKAPHAAGGAIRSPSMQELLPTESQLICEWKLIPLEEVMRQVVATQAATVVQQLNEHITGDATDVSLTKAANAWLERNKGDIAARAAASAPTLGEL